MFQKKTEPYAHVAIEAEALALREALECIANIQLPAHWDAGTKLSVIQDVAARSLAAAVQPGNLQTRSRMVKNELHRSRYQLNISEKSW